jgi:hypothetical protein
MLALDSAQVIRYGNTLPNCIADTSKISPQNPIIHPWNYPPGMLEAAATVLDSAPTKAAAPAALPRLGECRPAQLGLLDNALLIPMSMKANGQNGFQIDCGAKFK